MTVFFDTHCHLDAAEFDADRQRVHAEAGLAGVSAMLVPGVAVGAFPSLRQCVATHAGCVAAYGIHPLYVMQAGEGDLVELRHWLQAEKPVAVGEIGLDHFVADSDPQRQEYFFAEQLKLACEFDLPVILHVRRAVDAVLRLLRRYRVRGGIAHAFNGSRQQVEAFLELGFKLGFGGSMTFTGSTRIRDLAGWLPLDAMVLETDAPDIPPAWLAGGRNTPGQLPRIAGVLAELRGLPLAEIARQTRDNALQVLRLAADGNPGR